MVGDEVTLRADFEEEVMGNLAGSSRRPLILCPAIPKNLLCLRRSFVGGLSVSTA
jgi:hypothetical protein